MAASALAAVMAAGLTSPKVSAHHSHSVFDLSKRVNADATVGVWQFTYPHAMLWVYINDAQGKPVLWGLEAAEPQKLLRSGWDKNTVKPGDKVKVELNPLRDGSNGGNLVKITLADGRTLGSGGAGPTAPPTAP